MTELPRPNFFLVGSMRSGTTSLHRHLTRHPEIFMSTDPKEPSYFLEREQLLEVFPGVEKRGFWKAEANYLALFAEATSAKIIGEASANYARLDRVTGVAERIARFAPDAQIALIMRDPIERTISHYWYMLQWYGERRDPLRAFKEDPDYTVTSYYAYQLAPYLALFGRDRVYTLTTELLRDRAPETMSSLFRWLGVDDTFTPGNLEIRENVSPPVMEQVRGSGLMERFRSSRLWNAAGPLVPPQIRARARRVAKREIRQDDIDTASIRAYLRPIQREQTDELSKLLGRSFPEWTTLYSDE